MNVTNYLESIIYHLSIFTFFLLFSFPLLSQEPHKPHKHGNHSLHDMEKIANMRFYSDDPPEHVYGAWESVIPEEGGASVGLSLGMQTVHAIMLPSGKILLASGSSWRNIAPIEYYPEYDDPVPGKGLFDRRFDPFHNNNLPGYYQLTNNTAIYDPAENTFYRIPSPYPEQDASEPDHFIPNDFFCTGHMQLANGNPFFTGGTQYYYPYRTGNNTSYIFDWRKELKINWRYVDWRQKPQDKHNPWIFSGLMKRGRWYPTIVPLLDGRMAIFSGFVGFDKGFPLMYQFEINHFVEFFDPNVFDPRFPQKAWKAIDVKSMKNSPFATKLEWPQQIDNICYDMRHLESLGFDVDKEDFIAPCDCPPRCAEDHKFDAFRLYPHNYLVKNNRIYLTREGEWVSLRTPNTEYMRRTRFTYYMDVLGTARDPKVAFSPGPMRPDTITSYGTSFVDPNNGNINILGGQEASSGTLLPLGSEKPNHFAGGKGSRTIEQFTLNSDGGEGSWTKEEDFLGDFPQDDRSNHFAIILPTRQILIINGANYDFYGGVLYPILLTPQFDRNGQFVKYEKTRMAEAVEPRLYHNNAVLLPDGRVWVSGGNSARATVLGLEDTDPEYNNANRTKQPLPNSDLIDLGVYFYTDGQMAKQQKGAHITPTENWTAEIFSPPYMFIHDQHDQQDHSDHKMGEHEGHDMSNHKMIPPENKRAIIEGLSTKAEKGITFSSRIGDQTFYLLQSNKNYELNLGGFVPQKPSNNAESVVLLKLPSVTHAGQWGQHYVKLPIDRSTKNKVYFHTPDSIKDNIPPGYYMLFYVDRMGKPSVAQMVRFDDNADAP